VITYTSITRSTRSIIRTHITRRDLLEPVMALDLINEDTWSSLNVREKSRQPLDMKYDTHRPGYGNLPFWPPKGHEAWFSKQQEGERQSFVIRHCHCGILSALEYYGVSHTPWREQHDKVLPEIQAFLDYPVLKLEQRIK